MGTERAVIESDPASVARTIEAAALWREGNDPHDEIFVQIEDGLIETPASSDGDAPASYCTIRSTQFDRVVLEESVSALFPVPDVLAWLSWFEDSTVEVRFLGEPDATVVSELVIAGALDEVRIECIDDPAVIAELDRWLPGRFDGPRFLDSSGSPMPTLIEVKASELRRVVTAVEQCTGTNTYPITVEDGELQFAVTGDSEQVTGELPAAVEGPNVDNRYGEGLARIARGVDGYVTLQTGPDRPLAVVRERPGTTIRHVVEPVE